ncbi:MAG TPA: hypothetical protein VLA04_05135 [Verrucomicrobiae bacterium]|nr:hypothetical protein [Verrucomicrobiae bacterium]
MFNFFKRREDEPSERDIERASNQAPTIKLVDAILQEAVAIRATHIYLVTVASTPPSQRDYRCVSVEFGCADSRLDGMTIPASLGPTILGRLRVLRDNPAERSAILRVGQPEATYEVALTEDKYPVTITLTPAKEWKKASFQVAYEAIEAAAAAGSHVAVAPLTKLSVTDSEEERKILGEIASPELWRHLSSLDKETLAADWWFAREYEKCIIAASIKLGDGGEPTLLNCIVVNRE